MEQVRINIINTSNLFLFLIKNYFTKKLIPGSYNSFNIALEIQT